MTELQPSTNFAPMQTPAPKPSSPLLMIILIVFVLFSLAGIGFLYWQNQQMAQQLATLTNQQTAQSVVIKPTIIPTAAINLTTNWQTYTNTEIGFSFKYPQNWELKPQTKPVGVRVAAFDTKIQATEITPPTTREFFVAYNKNVSDLNTWLSENQGGTITGSKVINSHEFSIIKGGAMYPSSEYALKVGNNNYLRFVIEPAPEDSNNTSVINNLFDQILTTLQFTK